MKIPRAKKHNFEANQYGNKAITTAIPIDLYKVIKIKGMSFKELIIRGYQATEGFSRIKERLGELEQGNAKLNAKFGELWRKNYDLQTKLKEYEEVKE